MGLQPVTENQISVETVDAKAYAGSGIEVDDNITVERSVLGGTGIFYEGDAQEEKAVVRVPQGLLLDCRKLTEMQMQLKETEPENAEIVKAVLSCCVGINETEIVVAYMFGFQLVVESRHAKIIEPIAYYLQLLKNTQLDILTGEVKNNYFVDEEVKSQAHLREKYEEIVEGVRELQSVSIPKFEEYLHLNKVIRSRVLEIPHSLEDGSDDFQVNTTLVPFVDFANHQEENNAIFDVDRDTNDVILRYTHTGGKKELAIKYNDIVSIQQFVSVYGFIPTGEFELFEIKLTSDEINSVINRINETSDVPYDKIMKWLEILPTIQFIKTKNNVFINYDCNPVPLWGIFSANFHYLDWKSAIDVHKINDPDLLQESNEQLIALVEFQENSCDVIQGIEKSIAVDPAGIRESQAQNCLAKFNTMVKMIAKLRTNTVESTGLTGRYLKYEQDIYKQLQNQDEFEIPSEQYNSAWNDASRIRPLIIYDYL